MFRLTNFTIHFAVVVLAGCILQPQFSCAQSASPQSDPRTACAADIQKLCAGVSPGGGRVLACLKQRRDEVSDSCKRAVLSVMGQSGGAAGSTNPGSGAAPSTASYPATSSPAVPAPSVSAPAPAAKPVPAAKPSLAPKGTSGPVTASKPISVLGERFVQRAVIDTQQGGVTAVTVDVPESWQFEGKIEWNYGWVEVPVSSSWHAENPANAEAYYQYEAWRLTDLDVAPRWRQYVKQPKIGDHYPLGSIHMVPVPPMQAMAEYIKSIRGDVSNLKWLGQQDLPDLAKTLRIPSSPNQHGVAIKIGYDLNGKPVEEAFFGVYYIDKQGTPAMQAGHQSIGANDIQQINWGLEGLLSFRAPAGTLDKRMPVYCLIAKSVQYDPEWTLRERAISAQLMQMFNQKLKQGWDQIRAADALTDEIVRQNTQFLDGVSRQEEQMRTSGAGVDSFLRSDGSGGGSTRTSSDNVSDLIRNVDTMNDPSTGDTKQISNLEGYNHFTDGFGNYRTYDDPNATPENQGESGSWTRMTAAQ